jgi:hypothetical protein
MLYRNNVKYEGIYSGVRVNFTLINFNHDVVERFNEALARKVVESIEDRREQRSGVLR